MDENVLSTLALDESKSLAGIEPLHCSLLFTHCFYSFLLTAMRSYFESGRVGTVLVNELSGASTPNPSTELRAAIGRKKKAASVTLRPTLHYQRRYKSNKRKTSVAHTTGKYLELFWDFFRCGKRR